MKAAAFEQCPGAIKSDLDPVVLVFVLQMALDLIKWDAVQVVGFEPRGRELVAEWVEVAQDKVGWGLLFLWRMDFNRTKL